MFKAFQKLLITVSLISHHGCHIYQGYLFSRPLPLAEFEAFVAQF